MFYTNFKICSRLLVLLEMISFEHRNLQYDVNNIGTVSVHFLHELFVDSFLIPRPFVRERDYPRAGRDVASWCEFSKFLL